jgi:flagellar hook-associated protein 2
MAVSSTTSTGINVPEIVSGLMDVERVPVTKLQTQVDEKTLVISTLGVFQSKVSALESAAKALTTPGIYALRDTTSSDATKVSATASNSAAAATYAVKVAQTAQAEAEVLGGFQSASQVINLNNFSLTVGTGANAVTYSPKFGTLGATSSFSRNDRITMTLNGDEAQTFTVTTQTTPTQVASAINAAVTAGTLSGVFASVSDAGKLQIDAANPIQGVTVGFDVPGYATFASGQTFQAADKVQFTLADGAQQTFTLTTQTTATSVATAINAAVTAGTLSGVYASVESGALRLTSIDASKGLIASHVSGATVTAATTTAKTSPAVTDTTSNVVSDTFSLSNLASSINSLGANLQASVIQSGTNQYSLSVRSTLTGANNIISISGISSEDAQKDRLTLSGTYAVGDVITLTVNDQPLLYQVEADDLTDDGIGGAAVAGNSSTAYLNIATKLAAAYNASIKNGHTPITATAGTDGTLDFQADAAGTAFTASVSAGAAAAAMYVDTANDAVAPTAQVNKLEIAGRYTAGDVLSLTVNGLALNYTVTAADVAAGGSAAADHARIATALAAAYEASAADEHTPVGAVAADNVVTFTASAPGTAFTASVDKTVAATSAASISAINLVANVADRGLTAVGGISATHNKSGLENVTISAVYDGVAWSVVKIPGMPDDCIATYTPAAGTLKISSTTLSAELTFTGLMGTPKAGDMLSVDLDADGDAVNPRIVEHASIELQSARDAFVSINGQALQRSSNAIDDVVSGVTFNLNTPTVPSAGAITALSSTTFASGTTDATINVTAGAQDLSAEAVTDFVTAYNDLISFYKTETVASTDPDSRGVLNGDSNVRSFMDRLRGLYTRGIRLADGSNISFGSIGVEFQRDGTLYLDTGDLNTAVSNGLQDKLAAGVTLGYESSTSNFTSFLTASLRTTGLISTHLSDVEAQQAQLEERISDWEDKLSRIEDRYYRQYAALDALLFRLQTTSNALASAIDSLVNSQKS